MRQTRLRKQKHYAPHSEALLIRLTRKDKGHLRENAYAAGETMSAYIARRCCDSAVTDDTHKDAIAAAERLIGMRRTLTGIGTNMNQIAHKVNAAGYLGTSAVHEIEKKLAELNEIIPQLTAVIEHVDPRRR